MKSLAAVFVVAFSLVLASGCSSQSTCELSCDFLEKCTQEPASASCVSDCEAEMEMYSSSCIDAMDDFAVCTDGKECSEVETGCIAEALLVVTNCLE